MLKPSALRAELLSGFVQIRSPLKEQKFSGDPIFGRGPKGGENPAGLRGLVRQIQFVEEIDKGGAGWRVIHGYEVGAEESISGFVRVAPWGRNEGIFWGCHYAGLRRGGKLRRNEQSSRTAPGVIPLIRPTSRRSCAGDCGL